MGQRAPKQGNKTFLSGFSMAADSAMKSTAENRMISAFLSSIAFRLSSMLSPT